MGAVTTSLAERAESIFDDLGYTVTRDGTDIRAQRKWRTVHVSPTPDPDPDPVPDPDSDARPGDGQFRCFVTRSDAARDAYRNVAVADPEYDWAVIGVDEDGGYEVYRAT